MDNWFTPILFSMITIYLDQQYHLNSKSHLLMCIVDYYATFLIYDTLDLVADVTAASQIAISQWFYIFFIYIYVFMLCCVLRCK